MLTMVEVRAATGQVLALPLQDISSGFLIKEIEGLDPVRASLVSSRFGQLDGTRYQASRRENRNIVAKLGIQAAYVRVPVSELRRQLYGFFMPKSLINLKFFMDGAGFAEINGRVEEFDFPLFAQEPSVTISILCFDPDFYALTEVTVPGATVEGLSDLAVTYPGTVETGFIFRLFVDRELEEFAITNNNPNGETQLFEFVGLLAAGDTLEISTVGGNKYARLTRAGSTYSFLYGVSPVSTWLNLWPGVNNIRVQASGLPIPYEIVYKSKYGGL